MSAAKTAGGRAISTAAPAASRGLDMQEHEKFPGHADRLERALGFVGALTGAVAGFYAARRGISPPVDFQYHALSAAATAVFTFYGYEAGRFAGIVAGEGFRAFRGPE